MSSTESFAEAVRRLATLRSDEPAWKAISALLWPPVFATSYRMLRGNRALAEDATQETLLRIFRYARFDEFKDNPDAFRSYALATCRNVNLRYVSLILREQRHVGEVGKSAEAVASPDDNPELSAVRANLLAQFILSLDSTERKLLDLLLEGYKISEIADRLGVKYSNAAVRIHRLRNALAKSFKLK